MNAGLKLGGFIVALAMIFAAAALAGDQLGPDRSGESGGGHSGGAAAPDSVRGLAVSDAGLTLELATTALEPGRPSELRFSVRGADRVPVRDFEVEHGKRMHVIVVRRDGRGFQHLHPELASDGTWSVPVTLPEAGAHRVFADFSHDREARTLAADLTVDGDARYRALPEPAATVGTGDGYSV